MCLVFVKLVSDDDVNILDGTLNSFLKVQLAMSNDKFKQALDKADKKIAFLSEKVSSLTKENEELKERLQDLPHEYLEKYFASNDFFNDDQSIVMNETIVTDTDASKAVTNTPQSARSLPNQILLSLDHYVYYQEY